MPKTVLFSKGFMIQRLFTFSRRLVIVAVVCSLIAAMLVLLTGTVETLEVLYTLASDWSQWSGKKVMVPLVDVTDLFYIVALGLYELFVDSRLRIPAWLEIRSVDELKSRLAGVVVLGVSLPPMTGRSPGHITRQRTNKVMIYKPGL